MAPPRIEVQAAAMEGRMREIATAADSWSDEKSSEEVTAVVAMRENGIRLVVVFVVLEMAARARLREGERARRGAADGAALWPSL